MQHSRVHGNFCPERGTTHLLYWVQQAQRTSHNHALNLALDLASERNLPLEVVFILSDKVPDANLRHYRFMLQGLCETAACLHEQGLRFHLLAGEPAELLPRFVNPSGFLIMDKGYLNWQRDWRRAVKSKLSANAWCEVESDVLIPVEAVSSKEEYSAATIRGKILHQLTDYLIPAPLPHYSTPRNQYLPILPQLPALLYRQGMTLSDFEDFAFSHMHIDKGVQPVADFQGGYAEASSRLDSFLDERLVHYAQKRNDPSLNMQSELSPYLHFGQISALEAALRTLRHCEISPLAATGLIRSKGGQFQEHAGAASFLEELIVRRELSCNFCHFNPDYDSYSSIPLWARQTLATHKDDQRPLLYSLEELETAATADLYWNAAQREMVQTGKMHNYMRMYWGKKVIEWTPDPEAAFQILLYLNNKYSLDGRDPNSYAGIAWCFGKHDRPWQSRAVFGSVRYMNSAGLERKFNMQGYLERT